MSAAAVCTLFEGDFHLGFAVLVNSLVRAGYRGTVWAGFRGPVPAWVVGQEAPGDWIEHRAHPELAIRLVPLTTDRHLTNYKPEFLLRVWDELQPNADALFYFDPDIVVAAPWTFFTEWLEAGVALCEDVNSPLSRQHPRRVGWRRHFAAQGFALEFREAIYVNGGCLGVRRSQRRFVEMWRDLQLGMAEAIGGLAQSKLGGGTSERMRDPLFCFNASDQDALNAAIEATPEIPVSILGAEAMGFRPGHAILPHALGTPKPWRKQYLMEACHGRPPTAADKAFWQQADGPIVAFPPAVMRNRRRALKLAALIGRFMRRS